MTPKEFHEACHEACQECPQFRYYDDDQQFLVGGKMVEFGKISKKGMICVVKFWRDQETLWEHGYHKALPEEVQELFEKIDKLLDRAIKEALK